MSDFSKMFIKQDEQTNCDRVDEKKKKFKDSHWQTYKRVLKGI